MENDWRNKTVAELESDNWSGESSYSYLVNKIFELRKVELGKLSIEDLRVLIGQQVGIKYLLPLAIEYLTDNLFVEGDYYEGDLLQSVMSINQLFWQSNRDIWAVVNDLIKNKQFDLEEKGIKTDTFDPDFTRH